MKRVFIIHGWSGHPNEHWSPWLKRELEERGFSVKTPQMPDTDHPHIVQWVPFLAKLVGKPDQDTYLVGHSIGCQTIMRYLQAINGAVGGVVFVAGFVTLKGLETPEEKLIAKPWLETPIDFNKVKKAAKHIVAFFSDDDPFVPLQDANVFKEKLGAEVIIEKKKGHYTMETRISEVPLVLDALLKMPSR